MKRIGLFCIGIFICTGAYAEEITINWLNTDKTINQTTTCTIGGDVILPQNTPYKYGHTFVGYVDNYTPIEYLESSGSQWINTGYKVDQNTNVKTKIYIISSGGLFGNVRLGLDIQNNRYRFLRGGNASFVKNFVPKVEIKIETKGDTVSIYENGIFYGGSVTGAYYPDNNLSIFSAMGSTIKMKLYYFQIYNNDTLVRDFIPVLDSSGVACLYDRAEHKFYYNAGAGNFIAGPVIGE